MAKRYANGTRQMGSPRPEGGYPYEQRTTQVTVDLDALAAIRDYAKRHGNISLRQAVARRFGVEVRPSRARPNRSKTPTP